MKILVVGCGKIGTAIIASLEKEGYDITAVDQKPEIVDHISNVYDVMTLCGNGADHDALLEAGVEKADLFIATTDSDELNMLICFIARKMGAKHTIPRIRNPEYNDQSLGFLRQHLDLSMSLNPEQLVAREIFNVLRFPFAVKIESFSGRSYELVEIRLSTNSILSGLTLREMREKFKAGYLICAVQRGEEIFIPSGNFVLSSGDKIGISASPAEIQKLMKMLGLHKKQAKSVMLLGGGKTSYYLAKMLLSSGISVKIMEKNEDRCREISSLLPGAIVLHADGTQKDALLEEGLTDMDAFVSLTGIDEENILSAISVFLHNVPKVISKIDRAELIDLAGKIGLDTIVSPMEVTTNIVVRYARALENSQGTSVETLYKLMDGKAEALEFVVKGEIPALTQIPLKDLKLKTNTLIAGILRARKPIIPSGEDCILPGDRVVVLAAGRRLQDLSDILERGKD